MLVHVDGVDFRILDPTWLSISLFVLIPGLYAGAVTLLVERWLEPGAWPERAHPVVAYGPLLAILPFAPVAPLLALGWAGVQGVRRSGLGAAALTSPFPRWLGRAALTIVFLVAARDLLQDISTLT
jgi:hypothetical protein